MEAELSIAGRYRRYKEGTTTIVDWLVRAAGQCCDISDIVASLKTRGNKRRATSGDTTLEIRTSELLHLATAIASSTPQVKIPVIITSTLRDVIAGRKSFSDLYAAGLTTQSRDVSSIKSHQHFIVVLEEVEQILVTAQAKARTAELVSSEKGTPCAASTPTKKPKRKKQVLPKKDTKETMGNYFAKLNVHDCFDTPNDTYDTKLASAIDTSATIFPTVTFKLQKQHQDRDFALWCHLQDLNDVRTEVMKTWRRYLKGEVTFLMASITSNVAFGLMQCADDEFCALEASFEYYDKVLDFLGLEIVTGAGEPMYFIVNKRASDDPTGSTPPNLADLLCVTGVQIIGLFTEEYSAMLHNQQNRSRGLPPVATKDDQYDPVLDLGLTQAILANLFRGLRSHSHEGSLDIFMSGLQQMTTTSKLRTWLVVATQTYADAFEIIGPHGIEVGLNITKETLHKGVNIAQTFEKFVDDLDGPVRTCDIAWPHEFCKHAQLALDALKADTKCFDCGDVHSLSWKKEEKLVLKSQNFYADGLEKSFPLHAANTAYYLKSLQMKNRCAEANGMLTMHSIAYLYTLTRTMGLLSAEWHDLEFFIAAQATKNPFMAKQALKSKPPELLALFQTGIGVNPTASKMVGTRTTPDVSKKGKPISVDDSLVTKLFIRLREAAYAEPRTSPSKVIEIMLHEIASANTSSANSTESPTGRAMHSPIALLETFQKSFAREEAALNFDYISFWIECCNLLDDINEAVYQKSTIIGKISKIKFSATSLMAWSVLSEAAIGHGIPDLKLEETSVAAVAEVLAGHIKERGKVFSKAAYDQSSGRIPKSLWPQRTKTLDDLERDHAKKGKALRDAGCSFSLTGPVTAIFHSSLTFDNLNGSEKVTSTSGNITLPAFLIDEELIVSEAKKSILAEMRSMIRDAALKYNAT